MARKPRERRRPLFEIVDELCAEIAMDEDPKSVALLALGSVIVMCLKVGWTLDGLARLNAWPTRAPLPLRDCTCTHPYHDHEPATDILSGAGSHCTKCGCREYAQQPA